MITPDGIKKEFQISTRGLIAHSVLLSTNQGKSWEEVNFKFNEFNNTIVFPKAPPKDSLIMINYTSPN